MGAFKFLHVDDVHIGRERLEGTLPSQDFADAFNQSVEAAVAEKVAFVLIAGDFFDRSRIEPNHLTEGEAGLKRLQSVGIPAVAIEGNHDVVSSYDDRPSWLTYLNQSGLLRLLRTEFSEGRPVMKEWTDRDRTGNWLDLGSARIYGAGWFGASTAKRLELLAPHLERKGFTILMLHAGINGMAEEFGMIDSAQLAVVRDKVDYVALGHMHKRYVVDGYAYNAGAPENWDLSEARYKDEKGYWLVEIDTDGRFKGTPGSVRRRPVRLAVLSCNGTRSVDEVLEKAVTAAKSWELTPETAVQVKLTGTPGFNAGEIDRKAVEAAILQVGGKAVEVIPAFGRKADGIIDEGTPAPREAIEAEEIAKLVAETGRYVENAGIVEGLVRSVLGARSDEELYGELLGAAAPLLETTDENP